MRKKYNYQDILDDHIEFNKLFVSGFFTLTISEDFTCDKYELQYLTTLGENDEKIKDGITSVDWNEFVDESGSYGGFLLFSIVPEEEHQAGYYLIEAVSLGKLTP